MERFLLVISTLLFLVAFSYTTYALGAKKHLPSKFGFWMLTIGFAFQSTFLYLRGQEIGRCPVTNLFEILVFLSWSMVLIYLIIGSSYRLSLMGAFTAPIAFIIQFIALLTPQSVGSASYGQGANAWAELHAALSIIAYGAFALACVAGVMFRVQERMLKTRNIQSLFYHLPPVNVLAVANWRLLFFGLLLLTIGLIAGFAAGALPAAVKLIGSAGVWLIYFLLVLLSKVLRMSSKRIAKASVWAFVVSFLILGYISMFYMHA